MKNARIILIISMFALAYCASAQSYHGQASVLMGDYTIPDFGEVSTPELGNQFHHIGGEAFFSVSKRETVFIGGAAHSWSRRNTVVNSISPLLKGRLRGNGTLLEFSAGPTFQHRGHSAVGGTIIFRGEFRLGCDGRTTMLFNARAEAGGRGIFYDQSLGLRHRSFEGRVGFSSVTGGDYVQLNYFTCERYSLGITYAWDRQMNNLLESQGFGEYNRRALGIQAAVNF